MLTWLSTTSVRNVPKIVSDQLWSILLSLWHE